VNEPARTTVRNVQGLRAIAALMVVVAHLASPAGFEARYLGSRWIAFIRLAWISAALPLAAGDADLSAVLGSHDDDCGDLPGQPQQRGMGFGSSARHSHLVSATAA
jgi:hypothetical protein